MENMTVKEAMKRLIKEEIDYTVDGKCSRCTECCSAILPVSERELNKIKEYIRVNKIKPVTTGIPFVSFSNLVCPFADKKNSKCLIYSVRPTICREYICNGKKNMRVSARKIGRNVEIVNMNIIFRR